ncbi:heterokaryon incompatibility protein-domain-containing protein [Cercophora newfieldiana]|uniref:Heterokaryon incompatibility protein-domain-containing protein n=1 Tax=Cercophora newfieldiana TaxID=92897 RepID=A0AA39Y1V1_9PEZI|nr:heterokaryon incompatibility protein-domain-containing protein [Cercophora newfieldiana]
MNNDDDSTGQQAPSQGKEVAEALKEWTKDPLYCPVCLPVSRDIGIFTIPAGNTALGDSNDGSDFIIDWEVKLGQLADSAEGGCAFCALVAARLLPTMPPSTHPGNKVESSAYGCCHLAKEVGDQVKWAAKELRAVCEVHGSDAYVNILAKCAVDVGLAAKDERFGRVHFRVRDTNLPTEASRQLIAPGNQLTVELYGLEGEFSSEWLKNRPLTVYPGSEAGLQLARDWLRECVDTHHECHSAETSALPARVVEILDGGGLRLHDESGTQAKYAILSYCWGGTQDFATTKATLEDRKKGFSISDLPKTLQDAVTVVKELGLRYLWIDSICIIQDCEDDKNKELASMPSYYANAWITISAGGKKCTEGFLDTTGECEQHPGTGLPRDVLLMGIVCPDATVSKMGFTQAREWKLSQEPISKRAWTFQERVLSTRVIHYGTRMLWQCHSSVKSGGGMVDSSLDDSTVDLDSLRRVLRGDETLRKVYDIWYQVIREYTIRDASLDEDKLPAISALAQKFGEITHDEYLAGLWRGDILRGLLWSTYPTLDLTNPTQWTAPSWSWASNKNVISYDSLPPTEAIPVAKITHCQVTPRSTLAPFARLNSATLDIRGKVLTLPIEQLKLFVKVENRLPWPYMYQYFWEEKNGIDAGCSNWEPPDGCIVLVLFIMRE